MTVYDLMAIMQDIQYGYWNHETDRPILFDAPEFDDEEYITRVYRILRPDELVKKRVGTCFDCSLYEITQMSRIEDVADARMLYWESVKNEEFQCHSTVAYQCKHNNLWYWFEYSWYQYRGINGPKQTFYELWSMIKDLAKFYGYKKLYKVNFNVDYRKILKLKDISVPKFMKISQGK